MMDKQIISQIDLLSEQSWKNSRNAFYKLRGFPELEEANLTEREPTSAEENSAANELKLPVQFSERVHELLNAQENKEQLEEDLKQELMRWFWMGYYYNKQAQSNVA